MARWAGLLLLLLAPRSPEANVSNLQVAVEGDRVLASLVLREAFGGDLLERVESGLPTPIVYRFELFRDRKRWWDRGLAETTLEVEAAYDAVTREYTVNRRLDGKLVDSRAVRDREALAREMTRVEGVPVFSVESLPRGPRYLVRARAELGMKTVLWVVPMRIATAWAESNKFRP